MRSKLKWVLALLPALLVDCTSQREHTDIVCEELARCVLGEDAPITCDESLGNAIEDYRLSRSGLVQCSRCLERQRSEGCGCEDILVERHCDVACKEVQMVLNARTSPARRGSSCAEFSSACGDVGGDAKECEVALTAELVDDPTFAIDLQIDACLSCVKPYTRTSTSCESEEEASMSEGSPPMGGAGGAGGAYSATEVPVDSTCPPLLQRCADACSGAQPLAARFTAAASAIILCQTEIRECFLAGAASPTSGGAGGAPTNPVETTDCYAELVRDVRDASRVDSLGRCAACAAANPQCAALAVACADCSALFDPLRPKPQ
jgi:hypothetical protein